MLRHAPIFALLLLSACEKATPTPAPGPSATPTALASTSPLEEAALGRAQAAAQKLGGTMRTRLEATMKEGGPGKAIEVCAAEAQAMAASVRKETGAEVGRASSKLRNPADVAPPWVNTWLTANEGKKAAEVKGMRVVAESGGGKVARFLKPIELEAPCLACHGDPASLAPEMKKVIAEKYPADKATGYQVGDLRGALWAEVKVGP